MDKGKSTRLVCQTFLAFRCRDTCCVATLQMLHVVIKPINPRQLGITVRALKADKELEIRSSTII